MVTITDRLPQAEELGESSCGDYDEDLFTSLMECLTLPSGPAGSSKQGHPNGKFRRPGSSKAPSLMQLGACISLEDFVQLTYPLIDKEKAAEIAQSLDILEQKEARAVVAGCRKVVQDLKCSEVGSGLLKRTLITLIRGSRGSEDDGKLDARKISTRCLVGVRPNKEEIAGPAEVQGVVYRLFEESIVIALDEGADAEWQRPGGWQLELLANEVTYERWKGNLKKLLDAQEKGPQGCGRPHEICFGRAQPDFTASQAGLWKPFNHRLDASQVRSIDKALAARDIALIHGPPGTGKSTAVVELILQEHARGTKILAASASNMAVDNLVERLVKADPKMKLVRVGHPARMLPQVLDSSLEVACENSHGGKELKRCRAEIKAAQARIQKCGHRDHAERKALVAEIKGLRRDERYWQEEASRECLDGARVVCATLTGTSGKLLGPYSFGLAVIDEAAQALEVDCWAALLKARRAVLAGDHLQLPPTILSKEAERQGLGRTLFERLHEMYGESISEMLTVQYRMNEKIMNWSSEELYGGNVTAHSSIAGHLLEDLEGFRHNAVPDEDIAGPLLLIDTTGCDMVEEIDDDFDDSKRNVGEARVALKHCQRLIGLGVRPSEIGIITPYSAQVHCVKLMRPAELENLEVGTVDGFQGREKEAIIISMVRSNDEGNVGFLADNRRMNVAVTRARRHCTLVCNTETVSHDAFIGRLIKYFEHHGAYESAIQLDDSV